MDTDKKTRHAGRKAQAAHGMTANESRPVRSNVIIVPARKGQIDATGEGRASVFDAGTGSSLSISRYWEEGLDEFKGKKVTRIHTHFPDFSIENTKGNAEGIEFEYGLKGFRFAPEQRDYKAGE